MKVTLLGTGHPGLQSDRVGPSVLIEVGAIRLLFDCGRCTLQRLGQAHVPISEITNLFLTHLHSDHIVGIPDLMITPWIMGRSKPLCVWGPAGTKEMIAGFLSALDHDVRIRPIHDRRIVHGDLIHVTELGEGVVYESGNIIVTAFTVDHGPVESAFGYRIDSEGNSVVLSGDTRYCEKLITFAHTVDLLVQHVAAQPLESTLHADYPPIILSPEEAGKLFSVTHPTLAVYSHMVLRNVSVDELMLRTRKYYSDALEIGEDLMVIEVGETVTVHRLYQVGEVYSTR